MDIPVLVNLYQIEQIRIFQQDGQIIQKKYRKEINLI